MDVSPPTSQTQTTLPPGTICVSCLYDLGGLACDPETPCPECGVSIRDSLARNEFVANLAPELRDRLSNSLGWLAASACTPVLVVIALVLADRFAPTIEPFLFATATSVAASLIAYAVALRRFAHARTLLPDPDMLSDSLVTFSAWILLLTIALYIHILMILLIDSDVQPLPSAIFVLTGPLMLFGILFFFIRTIITLRSALIDITRRSSHEALATSLGRMPAFVWIVWFLICPVVGIVVVATASFLARHAVIQIARAASQPRER